MRRSSTQTVGIPRLLCGLFVSILAISLAVVLAGCGGSEANSGAAPTSSVPRTTSTTVALGPPRGSDLLPVLDLESADCFDTVSDPTAADRAIWKINCADPHTYEVYEVLDYDGEGAGRGRSYPGVPTIQDWSEQACYARFESFVGVRWTISDLDIRTWWPSERSWDNNDRRILCAVMNSDGSPLTGTQRGVAR